MESLEPTAARDRADICVLGLPEGEGNFQLFTEGDELYDAMISAIAGAEHDIGMESYIFAADEIGRRFAAALAARARAGVRVRLHLDSFGSNFSDLAGILDELRGAGVAFQWFRPFLWERPFGYIHRNHRKLLVVDGRRAFLGGFNIRRLNSRRLSGERRQRDSHVLVPCELARIAAVLFDRIWNDARPIEPAAVPETPADLDAVLVPSSSRRCRQRLACLHANLIDSAQHSIVLTSPYFTPGTLVQNALQKAARRGVEVHLLLPRFGDPPVAGWATQAAYEQLLSAGVHVYAYLARKLHAKTTVVDGEWAVIGSANLDYLSLFINQELVLVAHDRALAQALHASHEEDLRHAAPVILEEWRQRGWRQRGLEMFGRVARRFL